jgi:hypothetical protein
MRAGWCRSNVSLSEDVQLLRVDSGERTKAAAHRPPETLYGGIWFTNEIFMAKSKSFIERRK